MAKDVVYVPAIGTQDIKQEILTKQTPDYEASGVKFQGFYRDPYTQEIKTQNRFTYCLQFNTPTSSDTITIPTGQTYYITKLSVSFNNTGGTDYFTLRDANATDRKVLFQIPTGYSYYNLDFQIPIKFTRNIISILSFVGFGGFAGNVCLTYHGFIE